MDSEIKKQFEEEKEKLKKQLDFARKKATEDYEKKMYLLHLLAITLKGEI